MDGYSVTEAASVLGVPTERVWELLARGVLSGTPEGETGMRVFLQPRPAPAPPQERPNGNGGSHEPERELSPFRELLTEFRNLTERYGQALLALGESRGEVASLRSRVDLLEARMDLRLPGGPTGSATWSSTPIPEPAARAVMPTLTPPPAQDRPTRAVDDAGEGAGASAAELTADEHDEPRTRARGPRRATENFAEALARAEDPSPPELPSATSDVEELAAEAQFSHIVPAEPVPVADEEVGRPDAPTTTDEAPVIALAEDDMTVVASEPEPVEIAAEAPPEAEDEPEAAAADDGAEDEPEAAEVAEPLEWDMDRYTTAIGEPDWIEAEVDVLPMPAAAAEEPAAEREVVPEDETDLEPRDQPQDSDEPTDAPVRGEDSPRAPEPQDALDLPEARASASPSSQDAAAPSALPGTDELDAALDALRRSATLESARRDPWPQPPSRAVDLSALRPRPAVPPSGPAGRAYRRLRRIFPG